MEIAPSVRAYLSLGSNLGDRLAYLQSAIERLGDSAGTIISISPVYEAPPWGFESDSAFLNLCVSIDTVLPVRGLLKIIQEIEVDIGRVKNPSKNYSSRKIDIDIIFFGALIIQEEKLQVPHAHYTYRRFVLAPLKDIASTFTDPITHLTVAQIFANCDDKAILESYPKEF
ncbi:MAG: deoxyguanosine kinase [Crocinitomicaceae bacterium]|jgi:deoxyguanosine kinase